MTAVGEVRPPASNAAGPPDLRAAAAEMENAAWREGIDPTGPLGAFVTSMSSAISLLADICERQAGAVVGTVHDARTMADSELKKLQVANKAVVALQAQAQNALAVSEVQVEKVVGKFVASVAPEIVRQISGAVVLRERRYNQSALWGRAAAIAGVACCLVLGGYTWRAWTPDPAAGSAVLVLDRVRQCQAAPAYRQAQTGEAFCNLRTLLAGP